MNTTQTDKKQDFDLSWLPLFEKPKWFHVLCDHLRKDYVVTDTQIEWGIRYSMFESLPDRAVSIDEGAIISFCFEREYNAVKSVYDHYSK